MSSTFCLVSPEEGKDVRLGVNTLTTSAVTKLRLGCKRISRFSSWKKLIHSLTILLGIVRRFMGGIVQKNAVKHLPRARETMLRAVKQESFPEE